MATHIVDTSELSTQQVATEVPGWCRRALAGGAPVMRAAVGENPGDATDTSRVIG